MKSKYASLAVLLGLVACGGEGSASRSAAPETVGNGHETVAVLEDGPLMPGRYRFTVRNECAEDDPIACPPDTDPPPPLDLEVTVPAGWQHLAGYPVITPVGASPTEGPDGGALVLGWTNFFVGLNSDPCLSEGHEMPDVKVGPTVDDFVDAVQDQKAFEVTKPVDVKVGGHPGRFFSLDAPTDISGCSNWRPWDPGFYAQGPRNHWDVWVVEVDGFRVLIVTDYFPGTPAKTVAQLREMVESIRFQP